MNAVQGTKNEAIASASMAPPKAPESFERIPTWPPVMVSLSLPFAALMDEAEADVLAYMNFPAQHRAKLHSTNPLDCLKAPQRCRAGRTAPTTNPPNRQGFPTVQAYDRQQAHPLADSGVPCSVSSKIPSIDAWPPANPPAVFHLLRRWNLGCLRPCSCTIAATSSG